MVKCDVPAFSRVYVSGSSPSSVAVTGSPMFRSQGVFSSTVRVVSSDANNGGLFDWAKSCILR